MCNFKNKKDVLATVGDASGEVNHRIQSYIVLIVFIKYHHVIFEWTSGIDSSWKALWSAVHVPIDSVIVILMHLLTFQEVTKFANIDYDNKSELLFKFSKAERVASCLFDHPSDLLIQLTRRIVYTGVDTVQLKA